MGIRRRDQSCRAKVFARLVVSKETWQEFRALALGGKVTVARYVGILAERAAAR